MAYGEVTLKPVAGGMDGGEYENPDKLLKANQRTGANTYEPIHSGKHEAPEYASVEDTVGTTIKCKEFIQLAQHNFMLLTIV